MFRGFILNGSIDYLKYVLSRLCVIAPWLSVSGCVALPASELHSSISADGGEPEWCWHCKMAGSTSCSKTGITY